MTRVIPIRANNAGSLHIYGALAFVISLVFFTLFIIVRRNSIENSQVQKEEPVVYSSQLHPPTADELLAFTNEERLKAGVKPLPLDPRLNDSAQAKADDMTKDNYFDHVNPNTGKRGGTYIWDYIKPNPECASGSENITENSNVNESFYAIHAFMQSKPHREAILNPHDTAVGFGISGKYVVQHFCLDQ